jgi:N utilization substance protein B
MPDERYSIKIANNYGRFAAIIKVYEYFINEKIKHDEENFHKMSFGFHYVINDIFKNCLVFFDILDVFYTYLKTENKDEDILLLFLENKYCKILSSNAIFQKCLNKYDVKIKEKINIPNLCIKFFNDINYSNIKNLNEFEQFKTFLYSLIDEETNKFKILNVEENLFYFYKDIFDQIVNNFSENIFDNILKQRFIDANSRELFGILIKNISIDFENIEKEIDKYAINWDVNRISLIEKIIIALGVIEYNKIKTPKQVVINEYINFAKLFINNKAGAFVNGILDKIIK